MIVDALTGAEVHLQAFAEQQNMSIPPQPTSEQLAELGLAQVVPTLRPTPLHQPGPPINVEGEWRASWVAPAAAVIEKRLLDMVDSAADSARWAVAADPLRAVEYDRAAKQAEAFRDAGFVGEPPPAVASWAINGRSPQQAAEEILAEAAAYENGLQFLRQIRLAAKEEIRTLAIEERWTEAEQVALTAEATIKAAVAGVGNNG